MMHSYKLLFNTMCGLLLLSSSLATSQDLQLAGLSYTKFSNAKVLDSPSNEEMEVNEYNFFFNIPKVLKNEKIILINGLQYRLATPVVDNNLNLDLEGQQLHVIGYRFAALHQLGRKWKMLFSLNPTLSSTFNTALNQDDFLINGSLHFVKKKSDHFEFGSGIALTSSYGLPRFIPTMQLTFSSKHAKFEMLLPRRITYDHYFGKFTAGIQVTVNGSRYNANYSRVDALNEIVQVNQLSYTRMIAGPSLSYCVGKVILIEASGGLTIARKVRLQDDLSNYENYDISNSPFFQFGIAIVPSKKTTTKDQISRSQQP
ncbi:hypothetical protein SAMN04488029_0402 [Reichenbachiella faecimaris]|uniref:DUF6268 domain-containing protein n=1 Tax=Reichenbachiella faecimaris TaxID=692418 RepID=A0A1W2G6C8_REIFA|nr:DUF6268 family outer membrane beta-barrel protein [Reichenbachiella faecimaris]SMD32064.1 hypothetical protein SAMN04488029_0402 [Reichenbachiella faecimaris]